ncbi:hypothetical protein CYLTODRAFT_478621 [Cylindrobasidium torrendii FP15055 ss-10]|uniref:Uncharacterized protein n=1 Tax=Cylindrobasidium torrendii FP15055 ss-10 TaxID=1314674 RepID=A0A0D7ATU6_9AGAR|nr:hypothetical protein CYLTODRAFT_478621 [Cylindrobasidium torrendii FP15055 ss-10]
MSFNQAFVPSYEPSIQLPRIPSPKSGQIPPLDPGVPVTVLDALCAQEYKTDSVHLVTTSPNMDTVASPQYGWCCVEMDTAQRYGPYDPIFHPQLWRSRVPHYATIPWPSEASGLSPVLWEVFAPDDFSNYDENGALENLRLVTLRDHRKAELRQAWEKLRTRFKDLEEAWALGKSQILPYMDHKALGLLRTARCFFDGLALPVEVEFGIARVTWWQRTALELYGRLNWLELQPTLHDAPSTPYPVRADLMGAVVGKVEIADRFYRAGIPVWLVREEVDMPFRWKDRAQVVVPPHDEGFWRKRPTSVSGENIWIGQSDPWQSTLGYYAAGDLTRYAAMKRHLHRRCSPTYDQWQKPQQLPDWVHDEYLEAAHDGRLDMIPLEDTSTSYAILHTHPRLRPLAEAEACDTDWGDAQEIQTASLPPSSGPSRAPTQTSGTSRTTAHIVSTCRELPPMRTGANGALAKFFDLNSYAMPAILPGWRQAARKASITFVDNQKVAADVDAKYTLPPPEFIATLSDSAVQTYLKWRPLLLLRLTLPLDKVPSLRARAWRMVLGKGELQRPSERNKRGMTNWKQAESALQEAVSHFPHIEDVQMDKLEAAQPQWAGRWILEPLSDTTRKEIAWECNEANFRFELLRLDRYRYSLKDVDSYSLAEPLSGSLTEGGHGLDAATWDERRNKIFELFPHWQSRCVPEHGERVGGFGHSHPEVRGTVYLALWELMQTWTRGRIVPSAHMPTVVERLTAYLCADDAHDDTDAVEVAAEQIAFEYIVNFVDVFKRPPVLPRSLS